MKATLMVSFVTEKNEGSQGFASLEVDLPFAPTCDIGIAHPVWKWARKPEAVEYDLHEEKFTVSFGFEKIPAKENRAQLVDMYQSHGWTVRP